MGHILEQWNGCVRKTGLRLATWNVRWPVNPQSLPGTQKRMRIQRGLNVRKVVAIQETCCGDDVVPICEGLFPGTTVVAAAAAVVESVVALAAEPLAVVEEALPVLAAE